MKEATSSTDESSATDVVTKEGGPQGIGMAVAFDWALGVQILSMPLLYLLSGKPGPLNNLHLSSAVTTLLSTLIALPFAALLAVFGESIRRGWRWGRPIQVVANALLFVGGIVTIPSTVQAARGGNYWHIVTEVILLIFSPLIAWRLSRPRTAHWFATVKSSDARKRHGGAWPYLIAIWAIVGGILQGLASLPR